MRSIAERRITRVLANRKRTPAAGLFGRVFHWGEAEPLWLPSQTAACCGAAGAPHVRLPLFDIRREWGFLRDGWLGHWLLRSFSFRRDHRRSGSNDNALARLNFQPSPHVTRPHRPPPRGLRGVAEDLRRRIAVWFGGFHRQLPLQLLPPRLRPAIRSGDPGDCPRIDPTVQRLVALAQLLPFELREPAPALDGDQLLGRQLLEPFGVRP